MILLNEKKVAFIHIPKNGGTSIRAYLNTVDEVVYNESEDTFFVLGDEKFDKNHITLDMLHENFKTSFDLIKQYNSFCILRNPRERFYSSINQYFRLNKDKMIDECSKQELNEEISNIIARLKQLRGKNFPYDIVHFQPQVDYVMLKEKIIIKNLFALEKVARIEHFVKSNIDENFVMLKKNASAFIKNKIFAKILRLLYSVFKSVHLSFSERQISLIKSILFRNRDVFVEKIYNKSEIDSFIDDYYSKDFELIRSL
tara:strand:- start:7759 stop:8529 length:771 start_codon:yes stop_codon:yes gene_type:complete